MNDGGAGTTVFTRATTPDSVRIVKLSAGVTDSTGTGLRGSTFASARDFIFTYDNTAGTGRPISGTFVESDGTANSALNSYSAFYATNVDGLAGAFGMVLPNLLADRRPARRAAPPAANALVAFATDPDGLWPSGAQTVNPAGGSTAIILGGADVGYLSTGLVLTPSSLSFGNVAVSASKTDSLLAKNTAGQPITISSIVSSDTSAFVVTSSAGPLTVAAGDSTRVRILFHPRVTGQRGGRITFTDTGPTSPDTLHVSGNGVVPAITIPLSPLSFGAVSLTLAQIDTLQVRNPGGATLSISGIASNNASEFEVIDAGPVSVAPGDSVGIRVTFHPTTWTEGRPHHVHPQHRTSPDTLHVQGVGVRRLTALPSLPLKVPAEPTPTGFHSHIAPSQGLLAGHAYRHINQVVTRRPATSNGGELHPRLRPTRSCAARPPTSHRGGNYGTLTTDSSRVRGGGSSRNRPAIPALPRPASSSCASASMTAERARRSSAGSRPSIRCGS